MERIQVIASQSLMLLFQSYQLESRAAARRFCVPSDQHEVIDAVLPQMLTSGVCVCVCVSHAGRKDAVTSPLPNGVNWEDCNLNTVVRV